MSETTAARRCVCSYCGLEALEAQDGTFPAHEPAAPLPAWAAARGAAVKGGACPGSGTLQPLTQAAARAVQEASTARAKAQEAAKTAARARARETAIEDRMALEPASRTRRSENA